MKRKARALTPMSSIVSLVVSHGTTYHRVEVHQHLIVFQEEMIVHKDNSQGIFDMVFFQMLSKYFVKRISEALPDSNWSFATRSSGREL